MKNYAGERTQVFEARVSGGRSLSVSVEIGNDGVADKFWKRNELRISGHTRGYGSLAICLYSVSARSSRNFRSAGAGRFPEDFQAALGERQVDDLCYEG